MIFSFDLIAADDYNGTGLPSPAPSPCSPVPSPSPTLSVYLIGSPPATPPFAPGGALLSPVAGPSHLLRTLLISIAALVVASTLLLTYFIVIHRYCILRRRRATPPPPPPPPPHVPLDDELRQDLLAGGGVTEEQPYHVWHIRTTGLEEGTIRAIAAVPYRRGEGLVEGTICAVCLAEFNDGELLRLLPKCCHAFHLPCIDTWLRSHLNCPLCRAPIIAPPSPPPPAAVALPLPAPPSSSPSPIGDRPGTSRHGSEEIWTQIELGSVGSSYGGGRSTGPGGAPLPVRRSVSMDPAALGGLLLRMGLVGVGGSGDGGAKAEAEMGRSMSSSGGGFLLSRFTGRTRTRSAVLPL